MKTKSEVEYLKQNWYYDPCWDIEKTEGFEDYREELLVFRTQQELKWKNNHHKALWLKSCKMGISGNIALTEYLLELEKKIQGLEGYIDRVDRKR